VETSARVSTWYSTAAQQRISKNWSQSNIDAAVSSAPRVTVTFNILRDGHITNIQITQSSNNASVDDSARRAIQTSNPLMTLPAACSGPSVGVQFYFGYRKPSASQPQDGAIGMGLPDCQGNPVFQPKRVTLACGDGNFFVESLSWTGWGASFAAGVATGKMNDCRPSCAAGHFGSYPMVLIVTGKQRCPNG
jgi:TonB family protein